MSKEMRKETCGWVIMFCILSMWTGGIAYFFLDARQELSSALSNIRKLTETNAEISAAIFDVSSKSDHIKSLVGHLQSSMPPKTIIVNKDGCVPSECLAKVLLLVWDLRRSFALGAMSSDSVLAVKPLLSELRDQDIDNSLLVLEKFNHKKGYRELKQELKTIRSAVHLVKNEGIWKYMSRWVSVENRNDPVWQDFADLEVFVDSGAWIAALELVKNSPLRSVPKVQSWMRDLEFVLGVENHLSLIHNKLIERINGNPEGI